MPVLLGIYQKQDVRRAGLKISPIASQILASLPNDAGAFDLDWSVYFRNVSFSYPMRPEVWDLRNVSLSIKPG